MDESGDGWLRGRAHPNGQGWPSPQMAVAPSPSLTLLGRNRVALRTRSGLATRRGPLSHSPEPDHIPPRATPPTVTPVVTPTKSRLQKANPQRVHARVSGPNDCRSVRLFRVSGPPKSREGRRFHYTLPGTKSEAGATLCTPGFQAQSTADRIGKSGFQALQIPGGATLLHGPGYQIGGRSNPPRLRGFRPTNSQAGPQISGHNAMCFRHSLSASGTGLPAQGFRPSASGTGLPAQSFRPRASGPGLPAQCFRHRAPGPGLPAAGLTTLGLLRHPRYPSDEGISHRGC